MHKPRVLVVDDSASILRVVESVLAGAGYDVRTEQDGTRAHSTAGAFHPDLILLDFLMPQLNGHQVAQRLREERVLASVPVILMCSKGDAAAERSVKTLGIVDYITKPFSPDAILALVSYTLDRHGPGTTKRSASVDAFEVPSSPSEVIASDQTQVHTIPPELFEEATRANAPAETDESTDEPSTQLADLVTRVVTQRLLEAPAGRATADVVKDAVAEALALSPPTSEGFGGGRPALWGDLTLVPLPEVFQLMTLQGQTGLFQVWVDNPVPGATGPVRFDVYFGRGKVDFVQGTNLQEDFLLGRFLVARGAIERAELDTLLRARKGRGKLLGQQLVALGYITREQLAAALRDQCSELVYELLRSQRGTFSLRNRVSRPADLSDVHLGIGVDELLLEGLRRVDEWGVVSKEIPSFDVVLERDRPHPQDNLTDDEKYVLSHVDGSVSVRDIIGRTQMRPFDVAKVCYRLLMARHLRKGL